MNYLVLLALTSTMTNNNLGDKKVYFILQVTVHHYEKSRLELKIGQLAFHIASPLNSNQGTHSQLRKYRQKTSKECFLQSHSETQV